MKDIGVAEDKNLQSYSQVPNKRDGNLKFFTATLPPENLENFDGKVEAIFNTPFMIQIHAESIKKIMRAVWICLLNSTANPAQFYSRIN